MNIRNELYDILKLLENRPPRINGKGWLAILISAIGVYFVAAVLDFWAGMACAGLVMTAAVSLALWREVQITGRLKSEIERLRREI